MIRIIFLIFFVFGCSDKDNSNDSDDKQARDGFKSISRYLELDTSDFKHLEVTVGADFSFRSKEKIDCETESSLCEEVLFIGRVCLTDPLVLQTVTNRVFRVFIEKPNRHGNPTPVEEIVENSQTFVPDASGCISIGLRHKYEISDSEGENDSEKKPFQVGIHLLSEELKSYAYVQIPDFNPWAID